MELDFRFFFGVSNLSRLGWIFTDVIVVVRATDVSSANAFLMLKTLFFILRMG